MGQQTTSVQGRCAAARHTGAGGEGGHRGTRSRRAHTMDDMTASLRTLEQRLRAVEARLAEVEGGYGDTLYELRRASVRNELRLGRVLDHLAIEDISDDDVDQALDAD